MQTATEVKADSTPNSINVWLKPLWSAQPQRSFMNMGHSTEARGEFEYPKLEEVVLDIKDPTGEFIGTVKIEWIGTNEQYRLSVWNFSMDAVKHCADVLQQLATPAMLKADVAKVCTLLKSLGFNDATPYQSIEVGGAA